MTTVTDIHEAKGSFSRSVDEVAAGAERIIRNPVDRMLIAQAIREPMVLLTRDATLPEYGSLITVM